MGNRETATMDLLLAWQVRQVKDIDGYLTSESTL